MHSLTQEQMDALVGERLLPDVPRYGGTFGLVLRSLARVSLVLVQHVFPKHRLASDTAGSRRTAAWQAWIAEP